MLHRRSLCVASSVFAALGLTLLADAATGQIATDGTVGPAGTLRGPGFLIDERLGRRAGGNLFHSFARFGVASDETAVFATSPDVARIVSRVTGGVESRIDGIVSVADRDTLAPRGAEFWMINPAGFAFGPGAELRTGGSVFISSADRILFDDGAVLSADPAAPLTLTAATPMAFGFGPTAGRVTLEGARRLRAEGETFALVGGAVELEGAQIGSLGARIMLAGAGPGDVAPIASAAPAPAPGRGLVRITSLTDQAGAPEFALDSAGGEIALGGGEIVIERAQLRVSATPDGRSGGIAVRADALTMTEGASIGAITASATDAGSVEIDARRVSVDLGSTIRSQTRAAGGAGDVAISGFDELRVSGLGANGQTGVFTDAASDGSGRAGEVRIAGNRVILTDDGRIFSNTFGAGDAGSVEVRATRIVLEDGGQIGSGLTSTGDPAGDVASGRGGRVRVSASEAIEIRGDGQPNALGTGAEPSGVFTSTETFSPRAGPAGSIEVSAPRILLSERGEISSESFNDAAAGSVTVRAGELLSVASDAEITTLANRADSGFISVASGGAIVVAGAGEITTRVLGGAGRAGAVTLAAPALTIDGGRITSDAMDGPSGRIAITTDRLTVGGGGGVTSSTFGRGQGGSVVVRTGEAQFAEDAGLETDSAGAGAGGDVRLAADTLRLDGPSVRITAESRASDGGAPFALTFPATARAPAGPAGRIALSVGALLLSDGARISTVSAQSEGGEVDIAASGFVTLDGGAVTTSVQSGGGDGGDIDIGSRFLLMRDGAAIRANAVAGDGGDITIRTDALFGEAGTTIEAVSVTGDAGAITVLGAAGVEVIEAEALPVGFFDAFALIDDACVAAITGGSELLVFGRGGAPFTAAEQPALFGGALPYPVHTGGARSAPKAAAAPQTRCPSAPDRSAR